MLLMHFQQLVIWTLVSKGDPHGMQCDYWGLYLETQVSKRDLFGHLGLCQVSNFTIFVLGMH